MLESVKGLHLELTNKCTLKCPRCDRTTFIERFGIKKWKNLDLSLAELKSFFDISLWGLKVDLGGNDGDPIYHPDFLNIVDWLKGEGAIVRVHTNGSYKTEDWWQELSNILTSEDRVVFAIDGTPENFTKYRINAHWPSIELGIKTMVASKAQTVWKFIPFAYNETSMKEAEEISNQLGIDYFEVQPSTRWIENDPYKPINFLGREKSLLDIKELKPECSNGRKHYVSSAGYYSPCCYMGGTNFYYKTEFHKNKKMFSIADNKFSEILQRPDTVNFYKTIVDARHAACVFNCTK